jgi:hypothetical protein
MSAHRPNRMKRVAVGRGAELTPPAPRPTGCGALAAALLGETAGALHFASARGEQEHTATSGGLKR